MKVAENGHLLLLCNANRWIWTCKPASDVTGITAVLGVNQ